MTYCYAAVMCANRFYRKLHSGRNEQEIRIGRGAVAQMGLQPFDPCTVNLR